LQDIKQYVGGYTYSAGYQLITFKAFASSSRTWYLFNPVCLWGISRDTYGLFIYIMLSVWKWNHYHSEFSKLRKSYTSVQPTVFWGKVILYLFCIFVFIRVVNSSTAFLGTLRNTKGTHL